MLTMASKVKTNLADAELNDSLDAKVELAEVSEQISSSTQHRQEYHELASQTVVEVDVLEQLKSNLARLEDLHARMRFMMTEVRYLMKVR
jgi:hypothetical protein